MPSGEGNVAIRFIVGVVALAALVLLALGLGLGYSISNSRNKDAAGSPAVQTSPQTQPATTGSGTVITTVFGAGTLQVAGKGKVRLDNNPAVDFNGAQSFEVKQTATVELKNGTVTFVNNAK